MQADHNKICMANTNNRKAWEKMIVKDAYLEGSYFYIPTRYNETESWIGKVGDMSKYLRSYPEVGKFYRIKLVGPTWRLIGPVGLIEANNNKLEI